MHRFYPPRPLLVASPVRAALPASDNAADPAYNQGWTDGSNGGVSFDPWAITTNNENINHFAGTFIGDAGASGVNPAIDTNGRAFGMYSSVLGQTNGASVSAQRNFYRRPVTRRPSLQPRSRAQLSRRLQGHVTLQSVNYTFDIYDPNAVYHLAFTMIDATHLQADLFLTTASGTQHLVTLTAHSAPVATGFNLFYAGLGDRVAFHFLLSHLHPSPS